MNYDQTEDFLKSFVNKNRGRKPPQDANKDDTLAGEVSPDRSPRTSAGSYYGSSDFGIRLNFTPPRSSVPMRDATFQRDNDTYLDDENTNCDLPLINFGKKEKKPLSFENDDSPMHDSFVQILDPPVQNKRAQGRLIVQTINSNMITGDSDLNDFSKQVTLYETNNFEKYDDYTKPVVRFAVPLVEENNTIFIDDSETPAQNEVEMSSEKFDETIELSNEAENVSMQRSSGSEQGDAGVTYNVEEQLPNVTYVVSRPSVNPNLHQVAEETLTVKTTELSEGSEVLRKKIDEARKKVTILEEKAKKRHTTNFSQLLVKAKLSQSAIILSEDASGGKDSKLSYSPPLKQARMFNKSMSSSKSESIQIFSTPTELQQTSQPTKRKSQQVSSASRISQYNASELPVQQVVATPMNNFAQHVPPSSQRRRTLPASALKAVNLTRAVEPKQENANKLNPLYGPVQLKSVKYIKLIQELEFDPNWLKGASTWEPLSDDYLDFYGPTAVHTKTELKRKADTIVIRTINKFNGDMDKVHKYLWKLCQAHTERVRPYKEKMWKLHAEYTDLIKRHNDLVSVHNQLIQQVEAKKHADNEKFFAEIEQEIQDVLTEWKSGT